jgi:hypothetical protein
MTLQKLRGVIKEHRRLLFWMGAALVVVAWVLLYKLGSLVGGLSKGELTAASAPVGWHDLYHQPLELPLKLVRSAVFFTFPDHGQTLTRLPNVLFGALAIISFGGLVRLWHGRRTAVLALVMFTLSAWTLHVSRLASFDVLYFWALPTLACSHYLLRKYYHKPLVWYGNIVVWGLLLYIPGLVWFVLADIVLQRQALLTGWRQYMRWWQRLFTLCVGLMWLPLLAVDLTRPGQLLQWLGFPAHLAAPLTLLKQFVAVPVHLFIRGPQYPDLWLGKAPILDIFALVVCALGVYFYVTHWKVARTRYLAVLTFLGFILVGLGGPVTLSLLVPLLYMAVATGLAYLLHDWLKIFPNNPLARSLGIGLVVFAVFLSCLYNYRAYFIAWPHTAATRSTFHYHRQP